MSIRCPICGTNNKSKVYQKHGCLTCQAKKCKVKYQNLTDSSSLDIALNPEEQRRYIIERQKITSQEPTEPRHPPDREKAEIPLIKILGLRRALGLVKDNDTTN